MTKTHKIVVGIIVLILVLIGAFFAFNSYIYNEKQGDGTTDTSTTTDDAVTSTTGTSGQPKPVAISTAALASSFTVATPAGFDSGVATAVDGDSVTCLNPAGTKGVPCRGLILVSTNKVLGDLQSEIRATYRRQDVNESTLVIDGVDATLFTIDNYDPGEEGLSRVLMFRKDTTVYVISFATGYEKQFESVVSSFRFK